MATEWELESLLVGGLWKHLENAWNFRIFSGFSQRDVLKTAFNAFSGHSQSPENLHKFTGLHCGFCNCEHIFWTGNTFLSCKVLRKLFSGKVEVLKHHFLRHSSGQAQDNVFRTLKFPTILCKNVSKRSKYILTMSVKCWTSSDTTKSYMTEHDIHHSL